MWFEHKLVRIIKSAVSYFTAQVLVLENEAHLTLILLKLLYSYSVGKRRLWKKVPYYTLIINKKVDCVAFVVIWWIEYDFHLPLHLMCTSAYCLHYAYQASFSFHSVHHRCLKQNSYAAQWQDSNSVVTFVNWWQHGDGVDQQCIVNMLPAVASGGYSITF